MRTKGSLANKGNRDTNSAEDERLLTANPIENKNDKEEVEYWPNDVVNASHEEITITLNAKVLVENGGVVPDHVDAGKLLVLIPRKRMFEDTYPVI